MFGTKFAFKKREIRIALIREYHCRVLQRYRQSYHSVAKSRSNKLHNRDKRSQGVVSENHTTNRQISRTCRSLHLSLLWHVSGPPGPVVGSGSLLDRLCNYLGAITWGGELTCPPAAQAVIRANVPSSRIIRLQA